MRNGPDIAAIAALMGDPARSHMLTALMSGQALTATELAQEARVTAQTASSHLAKLVSGGLIEPDKQGRHRYYRLSDPDVADLIERLIGVAARTGHLRTRVGPRDPELREARACYDHLAGHLGVALFDGILARKLLKKRGGTLEVTPSGRAAFEAFGIDLSALDRQKRPMCRACLDWSERRDHLAGGLGAALLQRFIALRWATRPPGSRVVRFSPRGRQLLSDAFSEAPRRR